MIGLKYKFKSCNYLHNPPRQVRFLYFPPKAWVWSSNLQRRTNGKKQVLLVRNANIKNSNEAKRCKVSLNLLVSISLLALSVGDLNMKQVSKCSKEPTGKLVHITVS